MANKRRMVSSAITGSDSFLALPLTAQALYYHFADNGADDDGIVGAPLMITRAIGATKKDLEALISARFLLAFPSGRVVIKHWLIHNAIRKDRYTPSTYTEERAAIKVKPENRAYTLNGEGIPLPEWQPNGNQMATAGCRR